MLTRRLTALAALALVGSVSSYQKAAVAADAAAPTVSQAASPVPQMAPSETKPQSPSHWPGLQADGNTLLFNQWSLHPAGRQVQLGFFPVNVALHPSGNWAAVLHCGYRRPEIVVVDLKHQEVTSREQVRKRFMGSRSIRPASGCSPAERNLKSSTSFHSPTANFRIIASCESPIARRNRYRPEWPAADGRTLWVACAWGSTLARVSLEGKVKAERLKFDENSYPYAVVPSHDGRRLYVSLWGHRPWPLWTRWRGRFWAFGTPGEAGL